MRFPNISDVARLKAGRIRGCEGTRGNVCAVPDYAGLEIIVDLEDFVIP